VITEDGSGLSDDAGVVLEGHRALLLQEFLQQRHVDAVLLEERFGFEWPMRGQRQSLHCACISGVL